MEWVTPSFILQCLVGLASGAGAYAAIRADPAALHERATQAKATADHAHVRIDGLMARDK